MQITTLVGDAFIHAQCIAGFFPTMETQNPTQEELQVNPSLPGKVWYRVCVLLSAGGTVTTKHKYETAIDCSDQCHSMYMLMEAELQEREDARTQAFASKATAMSVELMEGSRSHVDDGFGIPIERLIRPEGTE